MACGSYSRTNFDAFIANANEVITFRLICDENDLKDEKNSNIEEFNPEFSHQLFGDNETIFGYKDLKLKLYYSSARLECYLGMSYAEKVNKEVTDGIDADNVLKIITDKLEAKFVYSLDEFCATLMKEKSFKPYGELINSFSISNKNFEIYETHVSVPGFEAYHQQMQTFLMWFIEAASYIDIDDDRWQFFVMYEKRYHNNQSNGPSTNSESFQYCFVGYATVYRYYAYPNKTRPKISQFLILPPFQKRGLGAKLLQIIYDTYKSDVNIVDVTVEDPSDNFTRIRDYVDCKNCITLDAFKPEKLKLDWSDEMAIEAQNKLKMSKKQARRVYEIVRFKYTDRSNVEEYKAYRICVKQRLNAPHQKQLMDIEKMKSCRKIDDKELTLLKQATIVPNDIRLDQLDKQYRELEDVYAHIIERLASQ